MCSRRYVSENDALEITTSDTVEIKKYVIAVLGQVLENGKRPRDVRTAIAKENGFFDPFHVDGLKPKRYQTCFQSGEAHHNLQGPDNLEEMLAPRAEHIG